MGVLEGKVAVITGSSRGLGLAIARAYAREGAAIVLASRSAASVESAVALLKTEHAQVSGLSCDVGDLAQVEALSSHAVATFGRFDLWVNNAGIASPYGPTAHIAPESFHPVVQTIAFGSYHGSLVALRHFLPKREGKLINILGWGARGPIPFQNAYAASKAWVRNFTMALAKEYRTSGVGIFAFNPGMMHTELLTHVRAIEGYEQRASQLKTVMRFWAKPPEVPSQKALWLASTATDGRTGLEIKMMTPTSMASGLLRDWLRRVARRSAPEIELTITTVPGELPPLIKERSAR